MKSIDLATISISGLNLIEASAGTGKTWTIAALYILLLLEKELRPDQILVVTYTKAATAELRERIRRRISSTLELYSSARTTSSDRLEQILLKERRHDPERARLLLTRALYAFDDAAIFTIHGFCQRTLMEQAFESGSLFDSELVSDQSALVRQVCDDYWRTRILQQPDEFIARLVADGYTPEKIAKPFEGHYQNLALRVIPQVAGVDMLPLIRLRDNLFAPLAAVWLAERSTILQQLESSHLHQGSYKPDQISTAAQAVDSWIAAAQPAASCSKLDFFSAQKIAGKTTKATVTPPNHRFFRLCQDLTNLYESIEQAFQDRLIACQLELQQWLNRELLLRKKALNQRCFDDLLIDLQRALTGTCGSDLAVRVRERYAAALIDEFQDTDPLQWDIFNRIGAGGDYPLFLIGDPKQAIYSFRGADIFAYLQAGQAVVPEKQATLATNFRSLPALVEAVNALFSGSPDPFLCRDIPFNPVHAGRAADDDLLYDSSPAGDPLRFWIYPRADQTRQETKPTAIARIVPAVAAECARLLEAGRYSIRSGDELRALLPHDIAVLVSTHKQADAVQTALLALGIPAVQQGGSTVFNSSEALDLLRIMRAVAQPAQEELVREALLTATMGTSANQIAEIISASGESPEWEAWLIRFADLQRAASQGGIFTLFSRLLDSCGVRTQLLARIGGERSLTNLRHCCELIHQAEQEQGIHLHGSISWLERRISGQQKDDATLLRLESDDDAVMIATIHASKGLQYPIVFIPFAWDVPGGKNQRVMFHDGNGALTLDLAEQNEHKQIAGAERAAEAARLLYVALTRAELRCYTVWGALNGASEAPLFNLLHGGSIKQDNKTLAALSDQTICDGINALAAAAKAEFSAGMMPLEAALPPGLEEYHRSLPFSCRVLQQPLRLDWRVASFSSITSGSSHTVQPRDHDWLASESSMPAADSTTEASGRLTIFDFPRGAAAGTCLHAIFERLNFADLNQADITERTQLCLNRHGFHESWLPTVVAMVTAVVAAPIIPALGEFSLSKLKPGAWQSELEFYLPISDLSVEGLAGLFDGRLDQELHKDFFTLLKQLSFRQSRGMLQGFIDLVFEYGGRYYIVDWKSNHLGNGTADYGQGQMRATMDRNAYILQYHLYTLALDRLLQQRLPDYCYEQQVGGVIYLFLRGLQQSDSSTGIYFERPTGEFIRQAGKQLLA